MKDPGSYKPKRLGSIDNCDKDPRFINQGSYIKRWYCWFDLVFSLAI